MRQQEFEQRPTAFNELAQSIQQAQTVVEQYKAGSKFYSHLADSDIAKVQQSVDLALKWLEDKRQELAACPLTENPPVVAAQIRQEKIVSSLYMFLFMM